MKTSDKIKLHPGEKLIHSASIHWSKYLFPVFALFAITMAVIDIAIMADFSRTADVTVFGALVFIDLAAVSRLVQICTTRYAVTNRRVIRITGGFSPKTDEISIRQCNGAIITQTRRQKLLAYGDIEIKADGHEGMTLRNVQNPIRFRLRLMEQMSAGLFDADTYHDHLMSAK